jgi:hypothetical protein
VIVSYEDERFSEALSANLDHSESEYGGPLVRLWVGEWNGSLNIGVPADPNDSEGVYSGMSFGFDDLEAATLFFRSILERIEQRTSSPDDTSPDDNERGNCGN